VDALLGYEHTQLKSLDLLPREAARGVVQVPYCEREGRQQAQAPVAVVPVGFSLNDIGK